MRALWLLLVGLMLPGGIFGETTWQGEAPGGFSAEVRVSAAQVTYPQLVKVDLTLVYPKGYRVDLGALQKNLMHPLAFEEAPFTLEGMTEKVGGGAENKTVQRLKVQFLLKPEKEGRFYVSFRDIQFVSNEDKTKSIIILSDLIPVEVKLPVVDPEYLKPGVPLPLSQAVPILLNPELRKQRDLLAEQEPLHNRRIYEETAFPWLGMLVLLLSGMFLFLSRRKPIPPPKIDRVAVARAVALRSLEELQDEGLPANQRYIGVSDLMRTFVWESYQIDLPTKTTQESYQVKDLSSAIGPDVADQLLQLLLEADRIKFAQQSASQEACVRATKLAKQII